MERPTDVLERLIVGLGPSAGPIEHVLAEWTARDLPPSERIQESEAWEAAMSVVDELGSTWGPTGCPSWVGGLVPGRAADDEPDDDAEDDFVFALYRRPGVYAYARLRGDSSEMPKHMRLVVGVLRRPADHAQE